jgi:hypothetical protein
MRAPGWGPAGRLLAVPVLLTAALLLAACGPKATEHATVQDARAAGVFERGRLPDVLPASGALIRIEAEADDGAYFHFSSADYAPLVARLVPLAQLPPDPLLQAWVKRKDLAGYTPYEFRAGNTRWLLLCAQSKGRCLVRRF